jgi:uncharacterized protein (DUF2225 family)
LICGRVDSNQKLACRFAAGRTIKDTRREAAEVYKKNTPRREAAGKNPQGYKHKTGVVLVSGEQGKFTNLKVFPMGAVVIQEGADSPKDMVLVLQGNIGVYKHYRLNNEVQLRVIGQGSFHGEMSLFQGHEQGETLVALTKVIVLVISRKNVNEFFTRQPDMAFTIVEGICKKLAEKSTELAKYNSGGEESEPSRRSSLFPDGHGSYTLNLYNNTEGVYSAKVTCPLCGFTFDNLAVLQSKLRVEKTDPDLRVRYKDMEPLYYEITTCPNCFFSAAAAQFEGVSRRFAADVNQKVGPYKLEMYIRTGTERDTFTVFAGYYLALLCAPVAFDDHQLITANLWLKISRLYQDCSEAQLQLFAVEKALKDYNYAYQNLKISEKQSQQLCYIMGDLYCQLGDLDAARNFFFLAKSNKEGSALMKRQADMRLEEIRELKRSQG